jgi:hypothetical protein
VPLTANATNTLAVFATPSAGNGLNSVPTIVSLAHTSASPAIALLQPAPGAFVRQSITLQAQATDSTGVASITFVLDGRTLATVLTSASTTSFTATTTLTTTTVADGIHLLTAVAKNRAGTAASVSQSLIVDNTPPDTQITSGPTGEINDSTATFTFTGVDNLTPPNDLQFAWRLDGGAFTAFSSSITATLTGLTDGAHTFEVKARDLAGNEDPTAAQRSLTVRGFRVTITEPANGATVSAGLLLVRGTVEASGVEVGVSVNGVTAAVQGTTFLAQVPVTTETQSLTASAATATGASTSHTIAISVASTAAPNPALLANPSSGVAPLTVGFSLVNGPASVRVDLDANGDGLVDVSGPSLEAQTFVLTQPGLYLATATAFDSQGNRASAVAIIQVFDRALLDASLKVKWAALKSALRAGDVNDAVEAVALSARGDYRELLAALGPQLSQIDSILTDISAVTFDEERAEYQMIRIDSGVRLSYLVVFVRDGDGIWRLKFF